MKKIINGKKYDTETAEEIASFCNGGGWNDFQHYAETLYKKRTGEFFLYGEGGPMTKYAESCGMNNWSGGEKIMPLGYEQAQKWAEENMDADDYEAVFGEVVEDGCRKTITVNLATSTIEKGKRLATQQATSLSALVERLIEEAAK